MKMVTIRGKEFRFNDHVIIELAPGPLEKRTGRLVQVRKGCGQFGSYVFFLRLRNGSLMTWKNVSIRRVDDDEEKHLFYMATGKYAPDIEYQPINEADSENAEYTIRGEFPEVGFFVETPNQPQTPGSFAVTVSKISE